MTDRPTPKRYTDPLRLMADAELVRLRMQRKTTMKDAISSEMTELQDQQNREDEWYAKGQWGGLDAWAPEPVAEPFFGLNRDAHPLLTRKPVKRPWWAEAAERISLASRALWGRKP